MKPLQRRLEKLENAMPSANVPSIIFISFVGAENGKPSGDDWLGSAVIINSGFGDIIRGEEETENAFRRRVYAMKVLNGQLDEMTNEELENALAAGSERLAKELLATGSISDESLEKAAGLEWSEQ
ncbi:hypothetical protein [uncultured Roseovarius sp.]|uniref:hypothetical protein n=1 Tax=uncultured Roseovarius sp. TaxID=293344 RepID=UPI0026133E13|nr:hypothetical protein [uncultured Roseovarius sp.]